MQEALADLRRKATTYSKHDLEASPPFYRRDDVVSDFRFPQTQTHSWPGSSIECRQCMTLLHELGAAEFQVETQTEEGW